MDMILNAFGKKDHLEQIKQLYLYLWIFHLKQLEKFK